MFRNKSAINPVVCLLLFSVTLQLAFQHSVLGAVLSNKLVTSESLANECEAEGKETCSGEFEHFWLPQFESNRPIETSNSFHLTQRSQIYSVTGSVLYLRGPPCY